MFLEQLEECLAILPGMVGFVDPTMPTSLERRVWTATTRCGVGPLGSLRARSPAVLVLAVSGVAARAAAKPSSGLCRRLLSEAAGLRRHNTTARRRAAASAANAAAAQRSDKGAAGYSSNSKSGFASVGVDPHVSRGPGRNPLGSPPHLSFAKPLFYSGY